MYNKSGEMQDDVVKSNDGTEQKQCEIGESLLELQGKKQFIEYKTSLQTATLSIKNVPSDEDTLEEEMINYEPGVQQSMIEKLTKVV